MTIKVQIQTPEQETSYLLIARSWESPEGKDHLIYPARCNFLGRYLLVPGRAEVTAQKGIYSDVENQVTIFYPLMSIGFASPRLWKTRVEFVCEINTRAAGCTGFCGDIYSWKQQNHQWVAFKKKKKIFMSPCLDVGTWMNFGIWGTSGWVPQCWWWMSTSPRCTHRARLGFSVWQHLLIVQLGITY